MSRARPSRRGRLGLLGALLVLAAGACVFSPDFSRYPACDGQGGCPSGFTCLAGEEVCLPDCGEKGACTVEQPSTPGSDGGPGTGSGDDGGTGGGAGGGNEGDAGDGASAPLVLAAERPPDGVEAEEYTFTFRAQGGRPPYVFSTPRALPPGLSLDSRGVLSGTPTLAGETPFVLEVEDQGVPYPRHISQEVTVRVFAALRVAGPLILADFPQDKAYEERLSAIGGLAPYAFELLAGAALPSGLALYEDGTVRGTSSTSGAASAFGVRVRDSARPPRTTTRSLQLTPSTCTPGTLCIRTRALPDARAGEAYGYTLQANTNTTSATWLLQKGPLPTGLQLSTSGVLSGTPTQSGSFELTIYVSEWLGTVFGTKAVTLVLKVY